MKKAITFYYDEESGELVKTRIHDDFEIETIEKDGSDYLLTFKCLDCKKVGSTSAKLPDSGWMS